MKKLVALCFVSLLILFHYHVVVANDLFRVLRVVDGDTVVIDYGGTKEKVRLLCVDTPESVHPDKKQNVPMGMVASDYTKRRLEGRLVGVELEGKKLSHYSYPCLSVGQGQRWFSGHRWGDLRSDRV